MSHDEPVPRPEPAAPVAPAPPAVAPSFEDLLVGALDRFERHGASGLAAYLVAHPAAAERLCRHLLQLHDLGFVGGAPRVPSSPAGPPPEPPADPPTVAPADLPGGPDPSHDGSLP